MFYRWRNNSERVGDRAKGQHWCSRSICGSSTDGLTLLDYYCGLLNPGSITFSDPQRL